MTVARTSAATGCGEGASAALRPRPWRAARITPLGELLQPGRVLATGIRLLTQVTLVACLWRALYAGTAASGGLDGAQAVGYAVLAIVITSTRVQSRQAMRDSVLAHVATGDILFWFLRPVQPWRYHLIRSVGDQLYGLGWAFCGYLACLCTGVVSPPASACGLAVAAVTALLGQVILYELTLLTDLLCFWTVMNSNAVRVLQFVQDLLSGSFAPLWLFPAWFVAADRFLPFQGVLNVPLSLYIGRLPVSAAPREAVQQLVWCVLLGLCAHRMWRSAAARVTVQGG